MSSSTENHFGSVFNADELAMLKEVFEEVCEANGHLPDTPAATMLAKALIAAYESGKRDRDALLTIVSPARRTG
jgi:hypothetical protein